MKYSTYIMTCVTSISLLLAGTVLAQQQTDIVIENGYGSNLEVVIKGQKVAENNKTQLLADKCAVTPPQKLEGSFTLETMDKSKADTKSLFKCEPISGTLMCVGQNTNQ
ncbi:hypothetical protein BH10PSE19_BH10PSE19_16530 [soil metagenome]